MSYNIKSGWKIIMNVIIDIKNAHNKIDKIQSQKIADVALTTNEKNAIILV